MKSPIDVELLTPRQASVIAAGALLVVALYLLLLLA
jgi:hypothetical protein